MREGVPAASAKSAFDDLQLGRDEALKALNLSAAGVNKKAKNDHPLPADESERVIGLVRLFIQEIDIVGVSRTPTPFDLATWFSQWLREPVPALGGARPLDLLDTMEGQALVSRTLAQMQNGAYA